MKKKNIKEMIKVKARFKGANMSLGYKTNKVYILNFITIDGKIEICDDNYLPDNPDSGQVCLYATLTGFLNNWAVIK